MSLRARIAAAASVSVAVAVLAAAVGVYFAVRSDLRGEIDHFLKARAHALTALASRIPQRGLSAPPGGFGLPGRPPGASGGPPASALRVEPALFGAASGYVEFISSSGSVVVPRGQGSSPAIGADRRDVAIARSGGGRSLSDRRVGGTDLRVLTSGVGPRGAVLVARPLTEVDNDLSNLLPLLALVAVGGVVLAALLGVLVARTALVPVARFTARTEALTGSLDLSQRLQISGRDELARLAQSFNATLDALERSIHAQRHLIADASHELRTPIASLQANVQVLREGDRLSAEDQESLRGDIEAELAELTSLVSDVVELARGANLDREPEEVRLDEIVGAVVERMRRRSDVEFELHLEPTIVRGDAARIDRAISNLLDNARKWSPHPGTVEVSLSDGLVRVRDHGPGFDEHDLPFVFDRFYRADRARKMPGSGLGLAIVRQVAEAHGGQARAENAAGGGAVLVVGFGPPIDFEAEPRVGRAEGDRVA